MGEAAAIALQGVLFTAWAVVSALILRDLLGRVAGGYPGPAEQLRLWRATLTDPATRGLRLTWLTLTVLLLGASALWAL